MASNFIVYGNFFNNKTNKLEGIVIPLDFSELHKRICIGSWEPGALKSDYEYWVPHWHNNTKCVLGKKTKYVRRKRNSLCFNGLEFDKKIILDYCKCTEEDYECDFGYYRSEEDNSCLPFEETLAPPEDCEGFYTVSNGYRKIPGDYCMGGLKKENKVLPCPVKTIKEEKKGENGNKEKFNNNDKKNLIEKEKYKGNSNNFIIAIAVIVLFVGCVYYRVKIFNIMALFKNCLSGIFSKKDNKYEHNYRDYEKVGNNLLIEDDDED